MKHDSSEGLRNRLMEKGVVIHCPQSVYIGEDVDPERIDAGVVIHGGSRIAGKRTLLCRGAQIGRETPATVEDCLAGPDVSLKGGCFSNAVFLDGASVGSGAHVREGTIFEEHASAAHTVGVKQTILFPFATLGSLINFCDCLLAGGTGPKNHSEVGSAFIHFNFTPQQDKITPSLLGDVPAGVMLNQPPIFLGGQGGLVGPARLAFGVVTAAGTICRTDENRVGRLIFGGPAKSGNIAYNQSFYRNIKQAVNKNAHYIANLIALKRWYAEVRGGPFISVRFPAVLHAGLMENIDAAISERISRLMKFAAKLEISAEAYRNAAGSGASETLLAQKRALFENQGRMEDVFLSGSQTVFKEDVYLRKRFLDAVERAVDLHGKNDYVGIIQNLAPGDADSGTAWMRSVVDGVMETWTSAFPDFA